MRRLPTLAACSLLLLAGCGDAADDAAAVEARATFLKGNAAFAASLDLERQAEAGDAEAFKAAVMRAEDALAYWQRAAMTRADWPEARRNVERALLRVEQLRERRKEGTKKKDAPKKKDDPPEKKEEEKAEPRKVDAKELPAERVLEVLDVLQRREQAKRALRQKERARQGAGVERDW